MAYEIIIYKFIVIRTVCDWCTLVTYSIKLYTLAVKTKWKTKKEVYDKGMPTICQGVVGNIKISIVVYKYLK